MMAKMVEEERAVTASEPLRQESSMKFAQLNAFGIPSQVVDCIEGEEPGAPGAGEMLIEVLACPINPAEILIIEGKYASKPPLPARLGIEGAGRVRAVGEDVTGVSPGDLVMSLGRANWAEKLILKAGEVIKAPDDIDVAQLSMLKINRLGDPERRQLGGRGQPDSPREGSGTQNNERGASGELDRTAPGHRRRRGPGRWSGPGAEGYGGDRRRGCQARHRRRGWRGHGAPGRLPSRGRHGGELWTIERRSLPATRRSNGVQGHHFDRLLAREADARYETGRAYRPLR